MSDDPATREQPGATHQDPMAADRRTLVVAAAAMVLLIGLGVVSAALFTGSACADIEPDHVDASVVGTSVPEVVEQAFTASDEAAREAIVAGVSSAAELLGPVTGAADVGQADRLARLGPGVAALGGDATVLVGDGDVVRATAVFGDGTVVLGDGETVYSVALANELTGQLDAIQPLDADLETRGSCLDAATVNVPFAFHLDAADGELLLLRSDEDAGDPELQLRDHAGALWSVPLEIEVAPPGVLGERFSGRLGGDLAVTARRAAAGESAAVVTAVGRDDGGQRWTLHAEDLPELGDGPVWVEVVGVGDEVVVVAMARDDARDERIIVGLDPADGAVLWADPAPAAIAEVVLVDGALVELVDDRSRVVVRAVDPVAGDPQQLGAVTADRLRTATSPAGDLLVALGEGGLLVQTAEGVTSLGLGAPVHDVVVGDDGVITVLVVDGAGGMTVTFGS